MSYEPENRTKQTLAEQVAEQILNDIVEKGLEVGAKIPNEFELAEKIGVGRGTIREAVKILVSREILTIRRGAGTFVSERQGLLDDPLGLSLLKDKTHLALDLLSIRLMLEPEIAALAAANARPEQQKELEKLRDQVEELINRGEDHTHADILFHRQIAACSGNLVMEKLIPVIHSSISLFVDLTNARLRQETIDTHREITDCIVRKDPEGARCAMYMHLTVNRRVIKSLEGN
ncbi:FadR/GntR family transcriptional regulator [Lacrimispora sp. 38-1]|uniref:FadR/GntR family transcriptional regulator n=1 Tax=Lacrimispora sp. 38-1 TaxID=3125778 RepID=UPI003CEB2709